MQFVFLFILVLAIPSDAHAYIDPVTGAMLINGIVVAVITVVAFFRKHIARLLIKVGLKKEPVESTEEAEIDAVAKD
jgi:hypothetical protein